MSASVRLNRQTPSRVVAPPTEFVDVQKGSLPVNGLMVSSALTIIATVIWPHIILSLFLIAQLASAVCFCTLFIRIKDGYLMCQFDPGWIRGKVALSEIESSRIVRSRLAYGWGFCRDERGRSFNRSGALALEILYCGGKRLSCGISLRTPPHADTASREKRAFISSKLQLALLAKIQEQRPNAILMLD
jgi:hypothetical protein